MNFEAIIREVVSSKNIVYITEYDDNLIGLQNWMIFLVEKLPHKHFKVYSKWY